MTANLMWQVWQLVCLKKPSAKLHIPLKRSFCRRAKNINVKWIPTKHASNSLVMFVTLKRFAILLFLPSCCVNSLCSFPKTLFNSTSLWAQLFSNSAFNQKYYHKVGWVSSCCESFFSKYYDFPLSLKPTLPSSNSIWNGQTCLNYFFKNS